MGEKISLKKKDLSELNNVRTTLSYKRCSYYSVKTVGA